MLRNRNNILSYNLLFAVLGVLTVLALARQQCMSRYDTIICLRARHTCICATAISISSMQLTCFYCTVAAAQCNALNVAGPFRFHSAAHPNCSTNACPTTAVPRTIPHTTPFHRAYPNTWNRRPYHHRHEQSLPAMNLLVHTTSLHRHHRQIFKMAVKYFFISISVAI